MYIIFYIVICNHLNLCHWWQRTWYILHAIHYTDLNSIHFVLPFRVFPFHNLNLSIIVNSPCLTPPLLYLLHPVFGRLLRWLLFELQIWNFHPMTHIWTKPLQFQYVVHLQSERSGSEVSLSTAPHSTNVRTTNIKEEFCNYFVVVRVFPKLQSCTHKAIPFSVILFLPQTGF